jgi:Flp pilus assembly pilin Flp
MSGRSFIFRRLAVAVERFHRDERGDMLEYLLVLAAFGIPLFAVADTLSNILSDYYQMIAFHVGWPFL